MSPRRQVVKSLYEAFEKVGGRWVASRAALLREFGA
jgi:hypothetical protein